MNNKFDQNNSLSYHYDVSDQYSLDNWQSVDYNDYLQMKNYDGNYDYLNNENYMDANNQYMVQDYNQTISDYNNISYLTEENNSIVYDSYPLDYQNFEYVNNEFYQPLYEPVVSNDFIVQNKKDSISDKDKSKWLFPKNFKKLSEEEFNKLSPPTKKQYESLKNGVRKIGYVLEKKSLTKFYRVSIIDFFPLFIGLFISFIRFVIGYSDIIRSINFDKKTVWDFRSNFIVGMIFSIVVWPILLICFFAIYPYIVLDSSSVTYAWNHLIDQLNINGVQALGTGLQAYFNGAIIPLFQGDILIATIVIFILVSMINVQTFLFSGLLNINRKIAFRIQRETVRDEIEKIRVQKNK